MTSNSKNKSTGKKHKTDNNIKNTERRNTSFLKELVENASLYKFVLTKIMTTHE